MKNRYLLFILTWLPFASFAQKTDSLSKKLDSLDRKVDSTGKQHNITNAAAYNETTKITVPSYFTLLLSDYKQQFTAPLHIQGRGWGIVGKFGVLAGGLAFADKPNSEASY